VIQRFRRWLSDSIDTSLWIERVFVGIVFCLVVLAYVAVWLGILAVMVWVIVSVLRSMEVL
jgi:hypothetical protein